MIAWVVLNTLVDVDILETVAVWSVYDLVVLMETLQRPYQCTGISKLSIECRHRKVISFLLLLL